MTPSTASKILAELRKGSLNALKALSGTKYKRQLGNDFTSNGAIALREVGMAYGVSLVKIDNSKKHLEFSLTEEGEYLKKLL